MNFVVVATQSNVCKHQPNLRFDKSQYLNKEREKRLVGQCLNCRQCKAKQIKEEMMSFEKIRPIELSVA